MSTATGPKHKTQTNPGVRVSSLLAGGSWRLALW